MRLTRILVPIEDSLGGKSIDGSSDNHESSEEQLICCPRSHDEDDDSIQSMMVGVEKERRNESICG